MNSRTFYQLCLLQGGCLALGFWAHHQFATDLMHQALPAGQTGAGIPLAAGVLSFLTTWGLTCGVLGLVLMRLITRPQACEKAARVPVPVQKESVTGSVSLPDQDRQDHLADAEDEEFGFPKRLRLWTQDAAEPFSAGRPAPDLMHSELRLHVTTRRAGAQVSLYTDTADRD